MLTTMREPGQRPADDMTSVGTGGARDLAPGRGTLVNALDTGLATALPSTTAQLGAQPSPDPEVIPAGMPAPATATAATLSPAQVAAAISFHTQQPWKYTKSVVSDIQNGVGVTPTGAMNAETVQAIAARQAAVNAERKPTPPLVVDGKAGPRTLPILVPQGLATDASLDTYTQDIGAMKPDLAATTSLPARAQKIMVEINARLAAVGVPPITKPVVMSPSLNAFTADNWTMTMGSSALSDPDTAAATMYHEARHAEQAFRVARMLAGKKHSAEQIAQEVPIDASVVPLAIATLMQPGTTEAVEAEGWHDDEIGRPSQAQQNAKAGAAIDKFVVAARAWKADPSPANRERASAAYDEWKAAYVSSYRDKPDEFDAFFLGDKVADKLGTPRRDDFVSLDNAIAQVTS
jgi:hypothetical protein